LISVGGAAVFAPVAELLTSDDLTFAAAEEHVLALATEQQFAAALAAGEARTRGRPQQCRVHASSAPRRQARRHRGIGVCGCCLGGAAVVAGVALPRGDDLAFAVAEPHSPAPTAAQQLAPTFAAGVARGRGEGGHFREWRSQRERKVQANT